MPLFGIGWSMATSTLNMLKSGALKHEHLRQESLHNLEKDITKEALEFKRKGKVLTKDYLTKQIYKDDTYRKLYKELGIERDIDAWIEWALTKG
jgi:hypothetical protein